MEATIDTLRDEVNFIRKIAKITEKELQLVSQTCTSMSIRKLPINSSYNTLLNEYLKMIEQHVNEEGKLKNLSLEILAGGEFGEIRRDLFNENVLLNNEYRAILLKYSQLRERILELKGIKRLQESKFVMHWYKGFCCHEAWSSKTTNDLITHRCSLPGRSYLPKEDQNSDPQEIAFHTLPRKLKFETRDITNDTDHENPMEMQRVKSLESEIQLHRNYVKLLTDLIDKINEQINNFPFNAKTRRSRYFVLKRKVGKLQKLRRHQMEKRKVLLDEVEMVRGTIMKCHFLESDVKELKVNIANGYSTIALQEKKIFSLTDEIYKLDNLNKVLTPRMAIPPPYCPVNIPHEESLINGMKTDSRPMTQIEKLRCVLRPEVFLKVVSRMV